MSALPLFRKKETSNKFLVAEIDTTHIKVLAFYNDGIKLKVIGSETYPLPENTVTSSHILDKDLVANTLKEAAVRTTQDLGETIKDIIIGIKGNMCVEITTTAKATSTVKRVIQEKDVEEVYNKIIEASFIQAQNDVLQSTSSYDTKLEIIISSTVYTKLNENLIENPVNMEGEILESAVFNAFCSSDDLKTLKKISKKAGLNLLSVAPIPYSLVQNISKTDLKENTDYTLINMNNDITEIIIVFGKGIVSTKTLPIGYSHLIGGVSLKMGLTQKEAEKVLESYSGGQLTESESTIVHACLMDILDIWIEGVKICFEDFTEVKTFANQIYITGKGTTIPDVATILKEDPWYKTIPFKAVPECRKLEVNEFSTIGDATGKINSTSWLPVQSLGIIYLEMLEQND